MKIKKEKGIAIPNTRRRVYSELHSAFSEIAVGDSLFIAFEPIVNDSISKQRDRICASLSRAFPKTVIARVAEGGTRVWKTAGKD